MVSSSSNNSIQKSKCPIIHTKIIVSIQVPYFSIPLIFFSSSFSSPLLLLLPSLLLLFFFFFPSLLSSFLPIRFCLSPKTKMRYLFWSYPYLILIFFLFAFLVPNSLLFALPLIQIPTLAYNLLFLCHWGP